MENGQGPLRIRYPCTTKASPKKSVQCEYCNSLAQQSMAHLRYTHIQQYATTEDVGRSLKKDVGHLNYTI